jgi:hypothetical protein
MNVQFELTLEDFLAANALARATHSAARSQRILMIAAPALGLLLVASFVLAIMWGNQSATASLRPALFFGIGLLVIPLGIRSSQRQAYKRSFPDKQGSRLITISVDQSGVSSGMPGVAESRYGWGVVRSFVENKHIALIYVAQVSFLMLPKRAFTSDQLMDIRSLMREHGIETKSC